MANYSMTEIQSWPEYAKAIGLIPNAKLNEFILSDFPRMVEKLDEQPSREFLAEYVKVLEHIPERVRNNFTCYDFPSLVSSMGNKLIPELVAEFINILKLIPDEQRRSFSAFVFFEFARNFESRLPPKLLREYTKALKLISIENRYKFTQCIFSAMMKAIGEQFDTKQIVPLAAAYATILDRVPDALRGIFTQHTFPAMITAMGNRFDINCMEPLTTAYLAILDLIPEAVHPYFTGIAFPIMVTKMGDTLEPDTCAPYFRAMASLSFLDNQFIQNNADELWCVLQTVMDDPQWIMPVKLNALLAYEPAADSELSDDSSLQLKHNLAMALQKLCNPDVDDADNLDDGPDADEENEVNDRFKKAVVYLQSLQPHEWSAIQGLHENQDSYGPMGAFAAAAAMAEYRDITGIHPPFSHLPEWINHYVPNQAKDYLGALAEGVMLPALIAHHMQNNAAQSYKDVIAALEKQYGRYKDLKNHCARLATQCLFNAPHQLFAASTRWHAGGARGALALRSWDALPIPPAFAVPAAGTDIIIPKEGKLVLVPLHTSEALALESAALDHCVGWFNEYVNSCTIGGNVYEEMSTRPVSVIYSHIISVRMIFPVGTDADEMKAWATRQGILYWHNQQIIMDDPILGPHIVLSTAELHEEIIKKMDIGGEQLQKYHDRKLEIAQHYGYNNGLVDLRSKNFVWKFVNEFNEAADQHVDFWTQVDARRKIFTNESFESMIESRLGDNNQSIEAITANLRRTLFGRIGTLGASLPKRIHGEKALGKLMAKLEAAQNPILLPENFTFS